MLVCMISSAARHHIMTSHDMAGSCNTVYTACLVPRANPVPNTFYYTLLLYPLANYLCKGISCKKDIKNSYVKGLKKGHIVAKQPPSLTLVSPHPV